MTAIQHYQQARHRFQEPRTADSYPAVFGRTRKECRERDCLLAALAGLPAGSRVLDLPCGNGRVSRVLAANGWNVTGLDSSAAMIDYAQRRTESGDLTEYAERLTFAVGDAFATGYPEASFDAVVCHRLMHHLTDADLRRAVLTEMGRVCQGRLVVSFFNRFALDAQRFFLKHQLAGTIPTDRVPIAATDFASDLEASGWHPVKWVPVRWGISPLWVVQAVGGRQ